MIILRSIAELRRARAELGHAGRVAFVPTMGALHEGHASLFRHAHGIADDVVASVFVNPTQFDDPADLAAYPKTGGHDEAIAAANGVNLLFVPTAEEMYPRGYATAFDLKGAALGWEGDYRGDHFNGVAVVCLKLFHLVEPDVAVFGQKDAQQVAVIRQIVRDTDLDLKIVVAPTVRDADGLALSSRNARLSPDDRQRALLIPRALRAGLTAHRSGGDSIAAARAVLAGLDVDYADVATFDHDRTLVIAARVAGVRLIDNVVLEHPERSGL